MPSVMSGDASIHYETMGSGSPILLLAGLGGVGRSWGPQVELFAKNHLVILPDHRGTGQSTMTTQGQTIEQHAVDMAALIRQVDVGLVHVVGSSTGGAIAQVLALDHAELVKSAAITSSWARTDAYFRAQFVLRRQLIADSGFEAATRANALFLFDPNFHRDHPDRIAAWAKAVSATPFDLDIALARFAMIEAHDQLDRLGGIRRPVLVLVGKSDFCTPPYFSLEMAARIPGAVLEEVAGGHFVYLERPEVFHAHVERFIRAHD